MTEIRPLSANDFDLVYAWENNPDLWGVSEQQGPFTEAEISSFMNRCLDEAEYEIERWVIISNGACIGAVDLFDYDQESQSCGLGIFITDEHHRTRGHATRALGLVIEMLGERHCQIIRALIYPDNHASIRLFEKLDFKRSGIGIFKGREVYHYFREITR